MRSRVLSRIDRERITLENGHNAARSGGKCQPTHPHGYEPQSSQWPKREMTSATTSIDPTPGEFRLLVLSAGMGTPSTTRMVAERIAGRVVDLAQSDGAQVRVSVVELRELAADITEALTTGIASSRLQQLNRDLRDADGVITSSPVFKAKPSGLFTLLLQVLDRELFITKPLVLAATAGTYRHTLVVDGDLRSQFAYLRALVAPTGVFAVSTDLNSVELERYVHRAAAELWVLMSSGVGSQMCSLSPGGYASVAVDAPAAAVQPADGVEE